MDFLKRQPSVDPERIVLYGNSRGAVASAMVATKVADLKAIILTGGVYDLRDAYKTSARGLQEAIRNEAGISDEAFLDRSALYHAHSIRSETLLLHGKYDDRASVDQAERFSEALARSGVPVRFHALDGGHRLPAIRSLPFSAISLPECSHRWRLFIDDRPLRADCRLPLCANCGRLASSFQGSAEVTRYAIPSDRGAVSLKPNFS